MTTEDDKGRILRLIQNVPFDIDTEIVITGRLPTLANSEFLATFIDEIVNTR